MIPEKLKNFIEEANWAFVASADQRSRPHLAAGRSLKVPDAEHIVFESWFCRKTLENVAEVPRVTLVVVDPVTGAGYQFAGMVERVSSIGILNGYSPEAEAPGTPQVESRMVVRVEEIMEFSTGAHSDRPITANA
jgi:predicted pyridoxine 5'-phosphate oxidase superfamily flavin-nucleotide-binding protein